VLLTAVLDQAQPALEHMVERGTGQVWGVNGRLEI
jgi:hypothetical protein